MRRIVLISIIIGSFLVIQHLLTSIYSLWKKQDLLYKAQRELALEKKEKSNFETKLKTVQSPEYIESEARKRLLLAKPLEKEILMPEEGIKKGQKDHLEEVPNWKKWYYFFTKTSASTKGN